jgi:hypothetical protein
MRITANWSEPLDIWFAAQTPSRVDTTPRYWNAFGTTKPEPDRNKTIACEINFPIGGVNRRVGGAFAEDEHGRWHIVHRGKIGGGREGIGSGLFFRNYRGEKVTVHDGEESTVALVGDLDSSRLAAQVALFVKEVKRVKGLASEEEARSIERRSSHSDSGFSEEPESRRRYKAAGWRQPTADHGLVVNALAQELERLGHEVRNDTNRDLFVIGGRRRVSALFEIKSTDDLSSVYQAIGQLFYHSAGSPKKPLLVLVSPGLPAPMIHRLRSLGLRHLPYKFEGRPGVRFVGLKDLADRI